MKRLSHALLGVVLACSLAGCEKLMRDMYSQPKYKDQRPSALFPDGASARPPVPGTVIHSEGVLAGTASGRVASGQPPLAAVEQATSIPYPLSMALLERGRERFDIYCAPCHSAVGDGDGMVARRGFPHPPSYHSERLRSANDRHFYDVITNGYGVMYSYADRVAPADRWAIVAYIRALQLSQYAPVAQLPRDIAARLGEPKR
jgi:mono/diheme cytochrome c family protein